MTVWEYAQLRVAYDNRLVPLGGKWTFDWHGPDEPRHDVVEEYGAVVAEPVRAGAKGWELVDVATLAGEDNRRACEETDWSLTRYTFKRPCDSAAARAEQPRGLPAAGR